MTVSLCPSFSITRMSPSATAVPAVSWASSGAVTVRLNRMEKNGWITRTRSDKDRRQYIISLTGDAMRMYQEYEDDWARRMDLLCKRYPEVQVDELLDMLEILTKEEDRAGPSP